MVAAGVNFGLDLAEEIAELKRERNAVILAHNYQVPELQDIADYVGDSLGLSYQAAQTDADVILFCGVHFMAETAKILNPTKKVLLPDLDAGCSLSESCPPEKLKAFLDAHADKNYYVIAYINCSAGVKALSDVICTSGNAEKIVRAAPADRNILFVPDQNLGAWVMERTGRKMALDDLAGAHELELVETLDNALRLVVVDFVVDADFVGDRLVHPQSVRMQARLRIAILFANVRPPVRSRV